MSKYFSIGICDNVGIDLIYSLYGTKLYPKFQVQEIAHFLNVEIV